MLAIIVQARMTSTRLPGKVLMEVDGRPLLWYQLERLRRVKGADQIIIATTTNKTDQPIVDFCESNNCFYFRGSEDDVLSRYRLAVEQFDVTTVVRVTSDCPLIDPAVVDKLIDLYMENSNRFDYVSNIQKRTYPRGMDCEIFSSELLRQIDDDATEKYEREHVTPRIYQNPNRYRIGSIEHKVDLSSDRWTVDTVEDFDLISRIIQVVYPINKNFGLADCLRVLDEHPDWRQINAEIEQKKVQP